MFLAYIILKLFQVFGFSVCFVFAIYPPKDQRLLAVRNRLVCFGCVLAALNAMPDAEKVFQ